MGNRVERGGLAVDRRLAEFIEDRALPGTGIEADRFWRGFSAIVSDLSPRNRALLDKREAMQERIDAWHVAHRDAPHDPKAYRAFLEEIGYIIPEGPDFAIGTGNIDPEFASIAGPQLVVPIMNARFALNAANARWGSLYDALYGTDALGDLPSGKGYDPARGGRVIAWVKAFLDGAVPLKGATWAELTGIEGGARLRLRTAGGEVALAHPEQYLGHADGKEGQTVLFENNALKVEVEINPTIPSARATRPVSRMCGSNPPSPPSWIARIPSPPSMPGTRSPPIPTGLA